MVEISGRTFYGVSGHATIVLLSCRIGRLRIHMSKTFKSPESLPGKDWMSPVVNWLQHSVPRRTQLAMGAVLVMFLWALCFPLINYGLSVSPPMTFAALRALIAGGVLLGIAQWQSRAPIRTAKLWGRVILAGFTATSLGFFGMFYGGGLVAPGLATVIGNTQPLIAALLAWAVLQERLTRSQRYGLVTGFAGVVLIGGPGLFSTGSQFAGMVYILMGAVGVAISNIVLTQIAGRVDTLRAMAWQLIIGSVPLALLAYWTESGTAILWSWPFVATLLTLSVAGTAAAFILWFWLLQHATLSRLNVYTFLTPVFGLMMGAAFFSEKIPPIALIGVVVSIAGIYWVNKTDASPPSTLVRAESIQPLE